MENEITLNTLAQNKIGVVIDDSFTLGTNWIYHNNLVNNDESNAYDPYNSSDSFHTMWDDGERGNFWSDFYRSIDGAWDNDSNNIIDTPYPIPPNSAVDNYPSKIPYSLLDVDIDAPSSVNENESFTVTITTYDFPYEGAVVIFDNGLSTTMANGQVDIIAPEVDEDSQYDIEVEGPGLQPISTSIRLLIPLHLMLKNN